MRSLVKSVIAAAMLALAAPAYAQLSAYNAAMGKQDYAAAADVAASTWATLDKSRADIGVIAHEFGFASYLAGRYEQTKTFGAFAAGDLATAAGDPTRSAGLVLVRVAELKLGDKAAPANLKPALEARLAQGFPDMTAILAADALSMHHQKAGNWRELREATGLAAKITAAAGDELQREYWSYRVLSAAADYLHDSSRRPYVEMAEVSDGVADAIEKAGSDAAAARLAPLYWQAQAWMNSMYAHLRAGYTSGSRINRDENRRIGTKRPNRTPAIPRETDENDPCKAELVLRREPQYPSSALYKGYVGTVIAKVDIAADGKVSNLSVLSAVPQDMFGEAVSKIVADMSFKPDKKQFAAGCTLERKDFVVYFLFMMR